MTTVVTPQPWTQRLAHQVEVVFRSGSTYVGLIVAALAGFYMQLDADTQAKILAMFPFLKGWGGVITLVLPVLIARLKPSNAVSTQTAALIEAAARARFNEWLAAHGYPPLPADMPVPGPAPVPAPAPVEPVVVAPAPPAPIPEPPPAFARTMPLDEADDEAEQLSALRRVVGPSVSDDRLRLMLKIARTGK